MFILLYKVFSAEKALESLGLVKDEICCVRSFLKLPVSRDLISSIKHSYGKYIADLEAEKERKKKQKTEREREVTV